MKGKSKGSTVKHCKMAMIKEIDRAEPRDGVFTRRAEILALLEHSGIPEKDIEEIVKGFDNLDSEEHLGEDGYDPEADKIYKEMKKIAEKAKAKKVGIWGENLSQKEIAEKMKKYLEDFYDKLRAQDEKKRNFNAVFNQGLAYNEIGQQDEAIREFEIVAKLAPKFPEAYYNMGLAYQRKGITDRAISLYTRAVSLNPRYTDAYINRGSLYLDAKRYSRALSDFNKAIRLSPKISVAYNNRGLVNYHRKQYKKAVADYNKAIKVDLTYSIAYYNLALAFAALGNYNRAWQNVHKVIQLDKQIDPAFLRDLRKWSGRNELTSKEELLNKELYDLFNKEVSDADG